MHCNNGSGISGETRRHFTECLVYWNTLEVENIFYIYILGPTNLNVETLRGTIKDPHLRTCVLCQNTEPQDEFYFLMSYTTFQPSRAKLFSEKKINEHQMLLL